MQPGNFNISEFIDEVFAPEPGERCSFPDWTNRRTRLQDQPLTRQARFELAKEWRDAFKALGQDRGFEVLPVLTFPAAVSPPCAVPGNGCTRWKHCQYQ